MLRDYVVTPDLKKKRIPSLIHFKLVLWSPFNKMIINLHLKVMVSERSPSYLLAENLIQQKFLMLP